MELRCRNELDERRDSIRNRKSTEFGVSSGTSYFAFGWAGFTSGNGTELNSAAAGSNVAITLNFPCRDLRREVCSEKVQHARDRAAGD